MFCHIFSVRKQKLLPLFWKNVKLALIFLTLFLIKASDLLFCPGNIWNGRFNIPKLIAEVTGATLPLHHLQLRQIFCWEFVFTPEAAVLKRHYSLLIPMKRL